MFKVVLVKLPFYNLFGAQRYRLNTYPLNLCYLSSALEKVGFKAELVDGEVLDLGLRAGIADIFPLNPLLPSLFPELAMNLNMRNIKPVMTYPRHTVWDYMVEQIKSSEPNLVGMTCYSCSMNGAKILTRRIKEELGVPVVLGGIHPTSLPEHTLRYTDADYVVIGEGELTLVELVERLASGKDPGNIRGIGYKSNEEIRINEPRELIPNLDKIPFPNRDFKNKEVYHGDVFITGRGCPFDCRYCASKVMWQGRVRYRSVDNIIEELLLLKETRHTRFVRIVDDTFTLNKKRVLELCDAIKANELNSITFSVGSRVDTLDEDMVRAMREAGIGIVTLGIESGSPKILGLMNKKTTPSQAINTVRLLTKYGIASHSFFMIGYPGETLEDVRMSKRLILEAKPNYVEVNMVSPYPKTELWDAIFPNVKPEDIADWYKWFHEGMSTHQVSFNLDREYRRFVWFTKYEQIKAKVLKILRGEE